MQREACGYLQKNRSAEVCFFLEPVNDLFIAGLWEMRLFIVQR